MKAIVVRRFGGPVVLQLEDVEPPSPGPGQVLVRVKAAGVNPVETYRRSGLYPRKPELPWTPGTDAAGVVEASGRGAQAKKGDRVYVIGATPGTYCELALCGADDARPLPAAISFAQGAALGIPYGTAYQALFQRGRAEKGETVLVHGASGGVGLAAVQLARAAGLTVIGTAGTPAGLQLVLDNGAHRALDHRKAGHLEKLEGVGLVVEMLANVNLPADLALLAPRGRVVVVGSRGPVEIDPRATMTRDLDVRGMSLANATPAEKAKAYAAIDAGLKKGALKPVIAEELPLAQAAAAHEAVMGPAHLGKIVLVP